MEAILACHPARSTEWLDCHPKSCELWRIRTGPILGFRNTSLLLSEWSPNQFLSFFPTNIEELSARSDKKKKAQPRVQKDPALNPGGAALFLISWSIRRKKKTNSAAPPGFKYHDPAVMISWWASSGLTPLESRRKFIRAVMAYKIVHLSLPPHLVPLAQQWLASHKNGQRTALRNKLSIRLPRPKTDYLKRSPFYASLSEWNKLAQYLKCSMSLSLFRKSLASSGDWKSFNRILCYQNFLPSFH